MRWPLTSLSSLARRIPSLGPLTLITLAAAVVVVFAVAGARIDASFGSASTYSAAFVNRSFFADYRVEPAESTAFFISIGARDEDGIRATTLVSVDRTNRVAPLDPAIIGVALRDRAVARESLDLARTTSGSGARTEPFTGPTTTTPVRGEALALTSPSAPTTGLSENTAIGDVAGSGPLSPGAVAPLPGGIDSSVAAVLVAVPTDAASTVTAVSTNVPLLPTGDPSALNAPIATPVTAPSAIISPTPTLTPSSTVPLLAPSSTGTPALGPGTATPVLTLRPSASATSADLP